ncbi:MAG: complex I NDUFA9 subunit family protein [Burkholderiales bacterium]|nr:complex I NDUFA9 subunit family protein [Burkholderiales bacterium]
MLIRNVVILGGSGFVGRHLARVLAERGIEVTVPSRNRERAKEQLIVLPTVNVVDANIHADGVLEALVAGADAVVNLVGILHESRRGDFDRVHAELPQRVVAACQRAGVERLVHMSALCADAQAPSRYLRSRAQGEASVMRAHASGAVTATAFRPSVIFGQGDSFLGLFARMLRFMPIVPLGSPGAKFQPVWVDDVARAFADALGDPASFGQRYELCGPKVYTLRELVELAGKASGYRRRIVGLGKTMSYLQALAMEFSPLTVLTRDNLRSMSVDNVCGCGWPEIFAFKPSVLEAISPTYLMASTRRYDIFRARARR